MTGGAQRAGYTVADLERYAPEPEKSPARHPFARDRARVLHCAALRRLAAKTQVVEAGRSDIPRTRLTHTLEVAQVAREMGAALGCDPDLVETGALAHDLGHPPFGHNGEDALHACAQACGGFEGNAQSLRILTRLEAKAYHGGRSIGLNLTRASLDAVTKYPWGPLPGTRKFGVYRQDRAVFDWMRTGSPAAGAAAERRCLEAQVMDWADDVAYSVHDVEDAVLLGLLDLSRLSAPAERAAVAAQARSSFLPDVAEDDLADGLYRLTGLAAWPTGFDGSQRAMAGLKAATSALIGRFCGSAQQATLAQFGPGPHARYSADLVVPLSTRIEVAMMKAVAVRYVMQRPGVARIYDQQRQVLTELVQVLQLRGERALEPWLLADWRAAADESDRLRVIIDQVASLTDISAMAWHGRLCG